MLSLFKGPSCSERSQRGLRAVNWWRQTPGFPQSPEPSHSLSSSRPFHQRQEFVSPEGPPQAGSSPSPGQGCPLCPALGGGHLPACSVTASSPFWSPFTVLRQAGLLQATSLGSPSTRGVPHPRSHHLLSSASFPFRSGGLVSESQVSLELSGRTWPRASSEAPGSLGCATSTPQMRSVVQPMGPGAQEDAVQDGGWGEVLEWPEFTQNVSGVGRHPSALPPHFHSAHPSTPLVYPPTHLPPTHTHKEASRQRIPGFQAQPPPSPRASLGQRSLYTDKSPHPLRKVGPREVRAGRCREDLGRGEVGRVPWVGPGQRQSLGSSREWCQPRGLAVGGVFH